MLRGRLSMKLKIILLSVFSTLLSGAILIPLTIHEKGKLMESQMTEMRKLLVEDFDRAVKQQIESVVSMVQNIHQRELRGELKADDARKLAADLIRQIRFGNDGYVWADTYEGVNVVYMGKDSEGKSRWDAKDAQGKAFIQEIIANGRKPGGGFTEYSFPKKGGTTPFPKRSYSVAFEPYSWVIGSGNYIDDIDAHVAAKRAVLEEQTHRELMVQILTILGMFAGILTLSYFMATKLADQIHGISARLVQGTGDLRSSISKILAVAHDLSMLSRQQAAAVQGTASAIEQISTTIRRSAENADESERVSAGSKSKAQEGQRIVGLMTESMGKIAQGNDAVAKSVDQTNLKMTEIAHMIGQINQKTGVINDIVFQTKLLSFNASIEAARAGEQGKGFSVVAEEVGNLAQVSGNAAHEISSLLQQSTEQVHRLVDETKTASVDLVSSTNTSVSEGNSVAANCVQVLRDIVQASDHVSSAISQIATASKEQATAVAEVSKSIQEIDRTTQVAAESGRISATAADDLAEKTKNISAMAASLETLLAGQLVLPKFGWVKEFAIGVDDMDAQHIELVRKMNFLAALLEKHARRRKVKAVIDAFDDLASYTHQHFSEEEVFMKSFGYPHLEGHQKIHRDLLAKLGSFAQPVHDGTVDPIQLMEFLINWLIHHILNSDKMYASAYRLDRAS